MTEDRRISDTQCWDAALVMGILYTMIYALTIGTVVWVDIPDSNGDVVKMLMGAMTVIQTTIVQYFFGNTKNADTTQRLVAQSKERTDSTMRAVVEAVAAPVVPAKDIKADDVKVTAQGDVTVTAKP